MLSRFRRGEEARRGAARHRSAATVDIVVGTHRLLQKDVELKDLGLARDRRGAPLRREAQGAHQEAARKLVDVLTLTATPIPRTLHMALTGIRDLSVIETPPVDRLAIRTYVTTLDDT